VRRQRQARKRRNLKQKESRCQRKGHMCDPSLPLRLPCMCSQQNQSFDEWMQKALSTDQSRLVTDEKFATIIGVVCRNGNANKQMTSYESCVDQPDSTLKKYIDRHDFRWLQFGGQSAQLFSVKENFRELKSHEVCSNKPLFRFSFSAWMLQLETNHVLRVVPASEYEAIIKAYHEGPSIHRCPRKTYDRVLPLSLGR
jgi:hypothetical protein